MSQKKTKPVLAETQRGRFQLWLGHFWDSVLLALVSAIAVVILGPLVYWLFEGPQDLTAQIPAPWYFVILWLLLVLGLAFIRHQWPLWSSSVIRSIKLFPLQLGIAFKVTLGVLFYCLLVAGLRHLNYDTSSAIFYLSDYLTLLALTISAVLTVCLPSLFSGCARRRRSRGAIEPVAEPGNDLPDRLRHWLVDDSPISRLEENRVPEHEAIARRILSRLRYGVETPEQRAPNVALIGSYGSGKTSICNLVETLAEKVKDGKSTEMLFCRFEAWPYSDPEAAVQALIDIAAETIGCLADNNLFGRVGRRYVELTTAPAGTWASLLIMLCHEESRPERVLRQLDDTLRRLKKKLVIFVDDMDRLEEDEEEVQKAVLHALNQLQNMHEIHYVIAAGHMGRRSPLDLLKLTRFQELVPPLPIETAGEALRGLRRLCLGDASIIYPWAHGEEGPPDPLAFRLDLRGVSLGESEEDFLKMLMPLIDTPRALKAVIRDTLVAWQGGLKGELNPYDMIFAYALKASEPKVFEWVLRDTRTFLDIPVHIGTNRQDERKKESEQLQSRLRELLSPDAQQRFDVVLSILFTLFPAFRYRLFPEKGHIELHPHLQNIGYGTLRENTYFERFVSGEVPSEQVPDQPALRYIDSINQDEFDGTVFRERYLETREKQTTVLNKITQFAPLLTSRNALAICEEILEFVAEGVHAQEWPDPFEFPTAMIGDVAAILKRHGHLPDAGTWVERQAAKYTESNAIVAYYLAIICRDWLDDDKRGKLGKALVQSIRKLLLGECEKTDPSVFFGDRFVLLFQYFREGTPDYEEIKLTVTNSLIGFVDSDKTGRLLPQIVFNLIDRQTFVDPGRDGVRYRYTVDKQRNDKFLHMAVLLPPLAKWYREETLDDEHQKAFDALAEAYEFA